MVIAGSCATAIGLGISRFDFGAVGRFMIDEAWISTTGMGDLAGLNLGAYLLGSLHHSQIRNRKVVLRMMMLALLLLPLSFWLEAFESSFLWQAVARICAGFAAGHLISGIPAIALAGLHSRHRRRGSGLVLAGGGIGALLGAFAIGLFAHHSAMIAWVVLALLSMALALPVLWLLSKSIQSQSASGQSQSAESSTDLSAIKPGNRWRVVVLVVGGGLLVGAGQVPISLYAPIVVAQKFGEASSLSSDSLALLGLGSTVGALTAAFLPRRWPTSLMLPLVSCIGLLASLLFFFSDEVSIILLATFLIGVWMWMTATLTYDRLGEFLPSAEAHRRVWAVMVSLAGCGYACFSFSFAHLASTNLNLVLLIGIGVLVVQLSMELLQRLASSKGPSY
ncbi:YbfB/YjiJ family MFS transporter [Prochlorococcus sp. MIT 1303]|uniref:YbfB/YjiJ family MFS transporter n=1 Tax=Prochlorococcus sp. MIT 1303 TaxID=1723647 RepID=UPI001E2855E4|nr:YbfB/YjiJ family MFS transporter [Prochlorococcus sp. MIT 1303]